MAVAPCAALLSNNIRVEPSRLQGGAKAPAHARWAGRLRGGTFPIGYGFPLSVADCFHSLLARLRVVGLLSWWMNEVRYT